MPVTRTIVLAAIALAGAPAAAARSGPSRARPGRRPGTGPTCPRRPAPRPRSSPPARRRRSPPARPARACSRAATLALNRSKRTFAVPFACQGNGTVSITRVASGTLARVSYRCAGGRATAQLTLSKKVATRTVASAAPSPATATIRQGARTQRVAFTLRAGAAGGQGQGLLDRRPPAVLAGRLRRPPYLVQPDFTTRTPTPISTRGWIAWYTAAGGWHWLGSGGENVGPLGHVDGHVSGIAQFHPDGAAAPIPFTWGPISSRPARGSTPSASTRSSTGSAAGRTTSGSTSTPARRARRRPARAPTTARTHERDSCAGDRRGRLHRLQPRRRIARPRLRVACSTTSRPATLENLGPAIQAGATLHRGRRHRPRRRREGVRGGAPDDRLPPGGADRRAPRGRRPGPRRADQRPRHGGGAGAVGPLRCEALRHGFDGRRDLRRRRRGPDARDRAAAPALAVRRLQGRGRELRRVLRARSRAVGVRAAAGQRLRAASGPARRGRRDRDVLRRGRSAGHRADRVRRRRPDARLRLRRRRRRRVRRRGREPRRRLLQRRDGTRDDGARASRRRSGCGRASAPERPGEVRRSCLAPGLAAELLGWHARTTLADGLARTLTSMARATRRARGA